jgi:DNA-directed RNA polymerase specialized sigma24 family protein
MRCVIAGAERDDLFQEIFNALRQWSELDRKVFCQAHYQGQSAEVIARSLQLDVDEVNAILKRCDRLLYACLRSFRKERREEPPLIPAEMHPLAIGGTIPGL